MITPFYRVRFDFKFPGSNSKMNYHTHERLHEALLIRTKNAYHREIFTGNFERRPYIIADYREIQNAMADAHKLYSYLKRRKCLK